MLRLAATLTLLATPALAEVRTYDFIGIDSIDARNGVSVEVIPGEEISITATARSGDVDQLIVRKFGPWLALNRNMRWFIFPYGRQDDIHVTITLPELRNIKAFDSAVATAEGFVGDTLRVEAIEGGTVSVTDMDVAEVTLVATETGALTITGTCDTAVAEAMFDATIMAGELSCANVAAITRAGAAITAQASSLASIDDSAGGTIDVTGAPEIVDYLPGMEPEEPDTEAEG